ncbi:MAG: hypothetical protein GC200_09145 [Tepidisphaera sp.]|nr:hypothetical protein [Tepidisphaera sp.]
MRYVTLGAVAALALAAAAQGAILAPGVYVLGNHPDGDAQPPQYGMRLDELVNVTSNHDIFTFDFNNPASLMQMVVTASTIQIVGHSYGGRDIGGGYANDAYLGVYTINFTYNVGVGPVPGDDDIWDNTSNNANFGSVTLPSGYVQHLTDERGSYGYSIRVGNEDNDLGHRGFAGVSGWGWLDYVNDAGQVQPHIAAGDWLFTVVPTPGSIVLLSMGVMAAGRRRR